MIEVKSYSSIHDIDREHWDSILGDEDVFHKWAFMRIVEDGRVENSRFRYLLFYRDKALVGSTVLSAFAISLDIFIKDAAWVRLLKRWRPRFFQINILICGLPASFGQLNLKLTDDGLADDVCAVVAGEMKTLAKTWGIRYLAVKEFLAGDVALGRRFLEEGFFKANSIPYMNLDIRWESFAEYMASLRHPYRRHARRALQKIASKAPTIVAMEQYDALSPGVCWVISKPSWLGAGRFHQLYLQVMGRTTTKLETLSPGFFEELFQDGEGYVLLSLVEKGNPISAAVLAPHGETLTFMLVGREQARDDYDSYFNLVSGIIAYAIAHKYKRLKMGQTAYWVKQMAGALPADQFLYFGCRSPLRHAVLARLNTLLFPRIHIKPVRAFNNHIDVRAYVPE